MNNKILSVVLVAGIATTSFAGISAANESGSSFFGENKSEIRELMQKARSGEELTADEQSSLDEMKEKRGEKWVKHGGKRKGGAHLSDEEKTAIESMSDNEKKAFFEAKKSEMTAQKEAHKEVIDTLIAGESLTAAQEATRLEMIAKMEDADGDHKGRGDGEWREIITKILAGDALTATEETQLAEMQTKHADREAQRAIIKPIIEKKKAGEELTSEEQTVLDEMKANRPEWKGKGRGEGKWHGSRGNHDMDDDIETDEDM